MTAPSIPALRATSSRTNWTPPMSGRVTLPNLMSWGTILFTVSTGTAKPTPLEAPDGLTMTVFMPMSSPAESRSGPPELPGIDRGVGLDHVPDREPARAEHARGPAR